MLCNALLLRSVNNVDKAIHELRISLFELYSTTTLGYFHMTSSLRRRVVNILDHDRSRPAIFRGA